MDTGRKRNAFIEIANENKGGLPTWGGGSSIRRTIIDSESGKPDAHLSHELPTDHICEMVRAGAADDVFTIGQCIAMINTVTASLQRQSL
jgi:hypothetical protein